MGTEACAGSRRVWLNCVSLIEQPFVVQVFKQVPESFYVTVVIGDVRVFHIYPVAYLLRKVHPLCSILHNLLAAGHVVFFYSNLLTDILLSYSQHLLHTKLYRKPVRIPTGLTRHIESALSLVTAIGVFNAPSHNVVDTRLSVCGRRTLEEYEPWSALPGPGHLLKTLLFLPFLENIPSDFYRIEFLVLCKTHIQICTLFN